MSDMFDEALFFLAGLLVGSTVNSLILLRFENRKLARDFKPTKHDKESK